MAIIRKTLKSTDTGAGGSGGALLIIETIKMRIVLV